MRNVGVTPALSSSLATASPRPPFSVWFSAVTTSRPLPASATMVSTSSGLTVGTCSTATSTLSAASLSAASSARMVMMPVETTSTSPPSRIICALPSLNL